MTTGDRHRGDRAVWRRFGAAALGAVAAGVLAGGVVGETLAAHVGARPAPATAKRPHGSPTPSPSPSPSPSPPSPSPEPTPTGTPTASAAPTPAATPTPVPPANVLVRTVGRGPSCTVSIYAETDPDRDGVSVDIRPVVEGTRPYNGGTMGGCAFTSQTLTVTLLGAGGAPLAVTGDPSTVTDRCATQCTSMPPGEGPLAASMGGGSFAWSNWCGAAAPVEARIDGVVDGVHASSTLTFTRLPACVAPGQRSVLTPPAP